MRQPTQRALPASDDLGRVLVYTVSRASTPAQLDRAFKSLLDGQQTTGYAHEWILWANSPELAEMAKWVWTNGQLWNPSGLNTGQHVALRDVLVYAREYNYDYVVKVDDDLVWQSRGWLRKLIRAEVAAFKFSNRHPVLGARILGLRNPPTVVGRIKLPDRTRLLIMPIIGGACRLHHISFFDNYVPDVRRAMGAGGDTSIAKHAEKIGVGMFQVWNCPVRHDTNKMERADPAYFEDHAVFQCVPFIPPWHPPNAVSSDRAETK